MTAVFMHTNQLFEVAPGVITGATATELEKHQRMIIFVI